MSLESAKLPRLIDKLEAKAEEVRSVLENGDTKDKKIIKKASKKK